MGPHCGAWRGGGGGCARRGDAPAGCSACPSVRCRRRHASAGRDGALHASLLALAAPGACGAARAARRGARIPVASRLAELLASPAQALFGLGTRDAAAQPDADDQAFLELLNDAIGKTETELFKRQGAVPKAPDRTAERYWSQYWLALLHDEEPLTPSVVAMRRTAKERMAFESSKYVNPALDNGKLDLFYAVSGAWPRAAPLQRSARRARRSSAAHCRSHGVVKP